MTHDTLLRRGFLGALSLLFFLVCLPNALAQEESGVEGLVVDARTGKPIPNVNVRVVGFPLGAATDESGRFVIRGLFRGEYRLLATHIGYKPAMVEGLRVRPQVSPRLVIRLEPRVLLFPPVETSARRDARASSERVVIDRETIRRIGASNLSDILALVPGVTLQRGSYGSTVSIRGSKAGQVLVLYDGVPLNDPVTGAVELESLPASLIESVEVVRGSASGLYGNGAIGGVVIVKPRTSLQSAVELAAKYGSYGFFEATPIISLKLGSRAFSLTGDLHRWGGNYPYEYEVGGEKRRDTRRNSDFRRASVLAQLGFGSGKAPGVRMRLAHTESERGLPGSVYALSPYARARNARTVASAAWQMESGQSTFEAQLAWSRVVSGYVNRIPDNAPLRYRSVPPYDVRHRYSLLQGLVKWGRDALAGTLELSIRGRVSDFRTENRLFPTAEAQTARSWLSSFGATWQYSGNLFQNSWRVRGKVAASGLITKIRSPEVVRTYRTLTPLLHVEIARNSPVSPAAYIHAAKGFRLPTYGDLFYQDYQVRGNPNLRPELSSEYAVGGRFTWVDRKFEVVLHGERFRRRVRDFITWRLGAFATFSPVNLDAEMDGYESGLSTSLFAGRISLDVTGQLLEAVNLSQDATVRGNRLPYRPDYQITVQFGFNSSQTRLNLTSRLVGPRWVTEANTVRLPGFIVTDVTGSYRLGLTHKLTVRIFAQVLNLFDARYQVLESAPLPGREWRFGLSFGDRNASN